MNTIKTIRIDDTKTIFVGADSWRVGKPDSTSGESWPLDLVNSKVRAPERRSEILALAAECKIADAAQNAMAEPSREDIRNGCYMVTEIDRAKPQVDVVTADLEASGWQNAAEFAARLRRGQP